jgi:hypothetical protein
VLCAVNGALRRQRRRLVMVAVMLGLAGAVVTAHSVMGGDHMGDGVVMCLAVAQTAVIAVGTALGVGVALSRQLRWLIVAPAIPELSYVAAPQSVPARAGPPHLQVFRF